MAQNPATTPGVETVTVTVDGKALTCRPDTSLAVSLWDHGIRHLSHSHKYGRPRGVTCARGHCTNCLMRVDGVPNVRTCETPVRNGMVVATQDTGVIYGHVMQLMLGASRRWIPVGFYYKWFTKPASLSRFFLDRVRPMAGVGRLPDTAQGLRALPAAPTTGTAEASTDLGHFTTIIVGAGPSGLTAAAKSQGKTLLVDDFMVPGGQRRAALRELADGDRKTVTRFPLLSAALKRLEAAVSSLPTAGDFQFLGGAKVCAGYYPNGLLIRQGDHLQTASCDQLVWAAGALDNLGLFPGNDTPGLMGPRALYRLLTRDGLQVAGRHALLIGGGLDFWLSAALLAERGAVINLVVTETGCQAEVAAAVDLKWSLNTGLRLEEIKSTGEQMVHATFIPKRSAPGPMGGHMHLDADLVVVCETGKPAYDIPSQLGAELIMTPSRGGFVPRGCDATPDNSFTTPVPGGTIITCTGETLGLLPTEQVTR